ncbi:MAG TPA: hypothetical protein VNW95_04215 [Mucilaginibacter sp.]|jgi:hypothetical protein|nr:hypothetical protein [Mucilaginibacter sp.]
MMNKLIRPIFCILFILAFGGYCFGQLPLRAPVRRGYPINRVNSNHPGSKLEQVKENFIGKQLKLTSNESRAFWPVYRQYVQEITAVRILKRMNNSDKSVDGAEQIRKDLDYESQIVSIRKQYSNQFLRILPPEKVSELFKSERAFNDELLKQLNERSVRAGD